jgi:L-lactate dehydrogenase complex protein LldG
MSTAADDEDDADDVGPDDGTLATFEASLRRLDVDLTRTTPARLHDVLAEVATEPAVGARLPFPDASLPAWIRTDPSPAALEAAETGVSPARLAVADYGSVALPATTDGAEPVSLFPPLHVPVVRAADVVPGMPDAFAELGPELRDGRGSVVLATGPSATADMGALVHGAHGPREVHVVLLTDAASDPGAGDRATDGRGREDGDRATDGRGREDGDRATDGRGRGDGGEASARGAGAGPGGDAR